jgi:tRNA-2-methylthio-N6-dimethylallyladenosine synthase
MQVEHSLLSNKKMIGKTCKVLIEGVSKRSDQQLFGRNSQNAVVIFDRADLDKGEYVEVLIDGCTSATLFGKVIIKV